MDPFLRAETEVLRTEFDRLSSDLEASARRGTEVINSRMTRRIIRSGPLQITGVAADLRLAVDQLTMDLYAMFTTRTIEIRDLLAPILSERGIEHPVAHKKIPTDPLAWDLSTWRYVLLHDVPTGLLSDVSGVSGWLGFSVGVGMGRTLKAEDRKEMLERLAKLVGRIGPPAALGFRATRAVTVLSTGQILAVTVPVVGGVLAWRGYVHTKAARREDAEELLAVAVDWVLHERLPEIQDVVASLRDSTVSALRSPNTAANRVA